MKTAKQKERELIIKLHQEKKTTREIADILGLSKSKTAFWVKRFKTTNCLEDKPKSGRPTKLNPESLKEIARAIRAKILAPKNKRAGILSKEVLALIEHKTRKQYSLRHAERILHKLGLSLITPRVNHIRKDEAAQEKFRVEFKKNSNRNIWAIQ